MALQQDTISIDLSQGVNNKVDDKIAGPEQTSQLVDARFDKDKRLTKRNGLTAQSQTFIGDFSGEKNFINPVVLNSTSCRASTFVHQNQLCIESNGNLFSQYTNQDTWVYKGTYVPMEININRLNANINFTDSVTVGGVTISCGSQSIYVSEEATGTIISKTQLAATEFVLRPIGFSNSAFVLTNSSATTVMNARQIYLPTGSVGSLIQVITDYAGYARPPNLAITSSASAVGEAAFIVFVNGSINNTRMVPFLSVGSTSSLGAYTLTSISYQTNAITIQPDINPNRLYIAGQNSAQSFLIGSTTYQNVWYETYTPAGLAGSGQTSTAICQAITTVLNPINNSDLLVYFGFYPDPNLFLPNSSIYSDDRVVSFIRIGSGGSAISNDIYSRGISLAGNVFRDPVRKTAYLPCVYASPLQTTVLLCDVLEGRDRFNYFMGKTLYGEASSFSAIPASSASFLLPQTYQIGTSTFRIINNRYFVDFNISPNNAPQTQYFANTTHLTGGMLWAYDGNTMAEHNFLIGPERLDVEGGAETIEVQTVSAGGGGAPEIITIGPQSAPAYQVTNNRYVLFHATTSTVTVYFTVDGIGTNPNLSGAINIGVPLTITDTAADVSVKILKAVNASAADVAASRAIGQPNIVTITNLINGDVPNATQAGTNRGGPLGTGSYQYTFIYSWTDKSGNVYRSLTCPPATITATGSAGGSIVLWAPPLTNKTIKDVSVEIYRTTVNGSIFYHLDTVMNMSSSTARIGYYDQFSDSSITGNRILYTNGGVLDNYSIGAVKSVAFFKERLQVTGVDDQYAIYYSKQVLPGEPVNFAAETFYRVDADLTPVTSTIQMDDKAIITKPNLVYVVSGDGANDLGEGSTLSPPLLVASDAGTSIPNSVVLYPNGILFKSSKGIYGLDRSLAVNYVGAPVENFNGFMTSGAVLMKDQTEIRFTHTDTSTAVVYNYYFGRWDYFSNYQSDAASTYKGKMVVVRGNGLAFVENSKSYDINNGSLSYSVYLETPWLKLKGVQDFQRIYGLNFLGQYLSPHTVNINVAYDYNDVASDSFNYDFNATQIIGNPTTSFPGGSVYQFQVNLDIQKCEAIKVKFTEVPDTTSSNQSSLYLNNMSAVVGLKKGLFKLPPTKQADS